MPSYAEISGSYLVIFICILDFDETIQYDTKLYRYDTFHHSISLIDIVLSTGTVS